MLTTLKNSLLLVSSVEYRFNASKILTIKINCDSDHGIVGSVRVELAEVSSINIILENGETQEDFFNSELLFEAVSSESLEYSIRIKSGITQTEDFLELPNNGNDITANVVNDYIELEAGKYTFKLVDNGSIALDGALIALEELNLALGNHGMIDYYSTEDSNDYKSINNQELTFDLKARVFIDGVTSNTNVPLLISKF